MPEDKRTPRKLPRQARAIETVDTILAATDALLRATHAAQAAETARAAPAAPTAPAEPAPPGASAPRAARTTRRGSAWSDDGISMRAVAREAGVSTGTLYQYFATRDALLAAWAERLLARNLGDFQAFFAALLGETPPPSPEEAIRRMVLEATEIVDVLVGRYGAPLLREMLLSPDVKRARYGAVVPIFAGAIGASRRPDRFRDADPEVVARMAMTTVAVLAFEIACSNEPDAERARLRGEAARIVVHYVIKDGPDRRVP